MRSAGMLRYLRAGYYAVRNSVARDHLYPLYASVKLERACPLRCDYCKYWREKVAMLDTDGVRAVLDNLARSSVLVVSFEGGEPLLRRDLGEILRHARRRQFIVQMTTSGFNLHRYPMEEYARWLDFLHVSIDEGHQNLHLFDQLDWLRSLGMGVAVQVVVTPETLPFLAEKVKRIAAADAQAVLMPAVQENGLASQYPDPRLFRSTVRSLKREFPGCIVTTDGFLDKIALHGRGCSAASIIVDCDGRLYYPCSVLDQKTIDLTRDSLMGYVVSEDAGRLRARMRDCRRACGWYQYFAVGSYIEPRYFYSSIKPYLRWIGDGRA